MGEGDNIYAEIQDWRLGCLWAREGRLQTVTGPLLGFLSSTPLDLCCSCPPLPHLSFPEFRPHGRWWAVDIHTRSQIYADSTEAPDCSSGPGIGDQRPGGLWQGVKTPQLQTLTVTATGGQQQDPV